MPVTGLLKTEIKVPQGVNVSLEDGTLRFRGKEGELTRRFILGRIQVSVGKTISLTLPSPKRRELAVFNTVASEIRNAIEGVTGVYEYKLKTVYAHFPIKVQVKGDTVVIENFLGERYPRNAKIIGGAKVTVSGDTITVRSQDLWAAGQTAANIERATRIKDYDRRVFQDGIYIIEKPGRVIA
ncbi:MAG: 50S ribosomal protein L6 [Methanomassiliicoccales archaeon]